MLVQAMLTNVNFVMQDFIRRVVYQGVQADTGFGDEGHSLIDKREVEISRRMVATAQADSHLACWRMPGDSFE